MIGPVHFINNKYRRWYFEIIQLASCRTSRPSHVERHHVLPSSLGGTDDGRVPLTYREHFIAHWLLTKFTTGEPQRKMRYALARMATDRKNRIIAGWQFETARKAAHAARLGRKYNLGNKYSAETRAMMSEKAKGNQNRKGRTFSDESKEKIRASLINYKHTAEARANMSASRVGKKHSIAAIENMRAARAAWWKRRKFQQSQLEAGA